MRKMLISRGFRIKKNDFNEFLISVFTSSHVGNTFVCVNFVEIKLDYQVLIHYLV